MAALWKCPNCSALLIKSTSWVQDVLASGGDVLGTATCEVCGASYRMSDVYGGKYDVRTAGTFLLRLPPVRWIRLAPLDWAIRRNDVRQTERILNSSPHLVHFTGWGGKSPLTWAIRRKNLDVIRALLAKGAPLGRQPGDRRWQDTALHIAADSDNTDVADVLLEAGADVNARNAQGKTPIFDAVQLNRKKMAKWLILHGADVFARDSDGYLANLAYVHLPGNEAKRLVEREQDRLLEKAPAEDRKRLFSERLEDWTWRIQPRRMF